MYKNFSTANLALIVPLLIGGCTYFYLTIDNLFFAPILCGPLLLIIIVSVIFIIKIKFPLYIEYKDVEKVNNSDYWTMHTRNVSWWRCLYFCILTAEPSNFVSLSSGARLVLFIKDNHTYRFIFENKPIKKYHRIFDIILMFVLSIISFCFAVLLTNHSWGTSVILFLLCIIYAFKKQILAYSLSVNVGNLDGCKVNVIYPYSTSRFHFFNYYGMAIPLYNTILITEKTFNLDSVVKEYVLNHERGHLFNRKIYIILYIWWIFVAATLIFIPNLSNEMGYPSYLTWLPLVIFVIYRFTLGKQLQIKLELMADRNAIKVLGKKKVLEALYLIKEVNDDRKRPLLFQLLYAYVPIERRIKFANEYIEKQT